MSIFGRLGYNSTTTGNNVTPLSSGAANTVASLPQFLNTWQVNDISTSNVSGYFQNPVITNIQNLWTVSNNISIIVGLSSSNANSILAASNTLYTSCQSFVGHTNRLSGVEPVNSSTATLPHYNTAVSTGKFLNYLTYQTDGIQNTAPIMGNFTSLFTGNTLVAYYTTINGYATTIQNSMVATSNGGGGFTYSSNLTPSQISTMATELTTIANFMTSSTSNDVTFYTNSVSVINDYNTVNQFTQMGDAESYLVNNFVGSSKLLSRLNS